MARVKIKLPKSFTFSTDIPVRITDLNYGGHVGNDIFLSIVHEARVQYLNSIGFKNEGQGPGGVGIIMTDAAIVYSKEVRYGETLRIEITAMDLDRYSFDLAYKISNSKTGELVAKAKTNLLCFDYSSHKKVHMPKALIKQLNLSD